MKKTGEEEETKTKSNQENKSSYIFDTSKYQSFTEEIVNKFLIKIENQRHELTRLSGNKHEKLYNTASTKNSFFTLPHFFIGFINEKSLFNYRIR